MEVKNIFASGMRMDLDAKLQAKDSIRKSYNGRILFNEDGSFSWENQYGNVTNFNIKPNFNADTDRYIPIGWCADSNVVVIFSKSAVSDYSEIGIVTVDTEGVGTYLTLFNDAGDPNGDLLNFKIENGITARMTWETVPKIRVKWCDGVNPDSNELRSVTFGWDAGIGPRTDVTAYYLVDDSVHAMNSTPDFRIGLTKFVERINGGLTTGVYQYAYRLVTKSGYYTPFTPLCHFIFMTSDQVNSSNWNLYEMEGVGLNSAKGNRIEIKGIDERYEKIEVAYLFSQTETTPTEAKIFMSTGITSDTMTFDHAGMVGTPIDYQELKVSYIVIDKCQTLETKDHALYAGNIVEGTFVFDPDAVLENLVITPIYKHMRSDELGAEVSITTPPLTNQPTKTGATSKNLYTGHVETYEITDDYVNYKGTQIAHLYPGFFRKETYRIGIVGISKKGFASPVYHIADVEFPDQYDDAYSWTRILPDGTTTSFSGNTANKAWPTNSFGDSDYAAEEPVLDGDDVEDPDVSMLRIQGLSVSGIDFSAYSDQMSGWQLVVCDRDKTILCQGLVIPTHRDSDISRPFGSYHQRWQISGSDFYDVNCFIGRPGEHANRFYSRPNLFNFLAPDIDFDASRLPTLQTSDRLRLVGSAWQDDGADYFVYFTDDDPGVGFQGLQKLYRSKNNFPASADYPNGFVAYGDQTDMANIFDVAIGDTLSNYAGSGLDIVNSIEIYDHHQFGAGAMELFGTGKRSLFIQTGNWGASPNGHGFHFADDGVINSACGYFITNYLRPNDNPYGGTTITALVNSVFRNVGHFVPMNNPTFTDPAGFVYDDCEFWGGDCYLDYHAFLRIYPEYSHDDETDNNDVSYGHIFPLESDLLHVMRQAATAGDPMYPSAGARPKREWNGTITADFPDGLFHYTGNSELLEEFNLNAVLLFKDPVWLLAPLDPTIQLNDHFPNRWRYTPIKIDGDSIDVYRIWQVNDFLDIDGKYGWIYGSGSLFDQIYSLQETAMGRLRASEKTTIESPTSGTLTVGVGDRLTGIDYITTNNGCQNKFSIIVTSKAIYFADVARRHFLRFAQDGLLNITNEKGIHDFSFYTLPQFKGADSPHAGNGIIGFWDAENEEVGWSFSSIGYFSQDRSFTLTNNLSDSDTNHKHYVRWNNQGIAIDIFAPLAPGNGMFLPQGLTSSGYFDILQFYVKHTGQNLPVYTTDGTTDTLIGTMTTGKYYRLYRNYKTDPWIMEEVIRLEGALFYNGITYNEVGNYVSSIQPFRSSFTFWINSFLYSTSYYEVNDNDIYLHNRGDVGEFYGLGHRAYFSPVINEMADATKVYDYFELNCNENMNELLGKVEMFTEKQGFTMLYPGDTRKKYREDTIWMPYRTKTQVDRMRGKFMEVFFIVHNLFNAKARASSLKSEVRISSKN